MGYGTMSLGSSMTITVNGNSITGTYLKIFSEASGIYDLEERTDYDNDTNQAIGFVVVWQNQSGCSDPVTTWSGQYQLLTEWVLSLLLDC